jgi:hypothetical protein
MTDLVLSRREVSELTRTAFRAKQAEFLRRNGIRHYLDGHGWPVVLRSSIEADRGGDKEPRKPWKSNKAA